MKLKFLLFRGNWENEGNFYALEDENTIIILSVGHGYYLKESTDDYQLAFNYLEEKYEKIKAIVINNTSFRNIGLLLVFFKKFTEIPIFTSNYNSDIISFLLSKMERKLKINIIPTSSTIEIDNFSLTSLPVNSYIVGNILVIVKYLNYKFFLIEDIILNNFWEEKMLFFPNFLSDLSSLSVKEKNTKNYIITSFHNIHWYSNNSLFLAPSKILNFFPHKSKFWILYEFDWLHIFELLSMALQKERRIQILDKNFFFLLNKILDKNQLKNVITLEKGSDFLLPVEHLDIENKVKRYIKLVEETNQNLSDICFVIGASPVIGGKKKLSRVIDFLHIKSKEIIDLSKEEYFKFGTKIVDWKIIFNIIKPDFTILLQNSYRNNKYLSCLPSKFIYVENQQFLNLETGRNFFIKTKRINITLEEMLINQRKKMKEEGLLVIFFFIKKNGEDLKLEKIRLESLAMTLNIEIVKLEKKIKKWWENELISNIRKDENIKKIREIIRKRLDRLIKSYLSSEYKLEIDELPIFLFIS